MEFIGGWLGPNFGNFSIMYTQYFIGSGLILTVINSFPHLIALNVDLLMIS